jgi:hypothetical protein
VFILAMAYDLEDYSECGLVHHLVFRKSTEVQKSVSETGLVSVLRFSYRAHWTRYFSTFLPVGGKKSGFQNGVFFGTFWNTS